MANWVAAMRWRQMVMKSAMTATNTTCEAIKCAPSIAATKASFPHSGWLMAKAAAVSATPMMPTAKSRLPPNRSMAGPNRMPMKAATPLNGPYHAE